MKRAIPPRADQCPLCLQKSEDGYDEENGAKEIEKTVGVGDLHLDRHQGEEKEGARYQEGDASNEIEGYPPTVPDKLTQLYAHHDPHRGEEGQDIVRELCL